MFKFQGSLSASKSWMNRALITQHFNSEIKIEGQSDSDDVRVLRQAIGAIHSTSQFDLGQGGTSLRFFAFLISRYPGEWFLHGHSRLLARPQNEIKEFLNQLGVQVQFETDHIKINSTGWKIAQPLRCQAENSSQFLSGIALSAWDLNSDLVIHIKKPITSIDYFKMTLQLLQMMGMEMSMSEDEESIELVIYKGQKPHAQSLQAELDISSAFALIAAGVIDGSVEITNWNSETLQPDIAFLEIFKKMGIQVDTNTHSLKIKKHNNWKACEVNLNSSPDLFPVLSVLCALAKGESKLYGAEQLRFKESNRIEKTKELLDLVGIKCEVLPDGIIIQGQSSTADKKILKRFNPDDDHRMAMAAGLLKLAGFNIEVQNPQVVNKSYPQFFQHIEVKP